MFFMPPFVAHAMTDTFLLQSRQLFTVLLVKTRLWLKGRVAGGFSIVRRHKQLNPPDFVLTLGQTVHNLSNRHAFDVNVNVKMYTIG